MSHALSKPADARQRVDGSAADFDPLLGAWRNLDSHTLYIAEFELSRTDSGYGLRVQGSGAVDWGTADASVHAANGTTRAQGFYAGFDLGAVQTHISANLNQGILVVQSYTRYADDRPAHFAKEYFRKVGA